MFEWWCICRLAPLPRRFREKRIHFICNNIRESNVKEDGVTINTPMCFFDFCRFISLLIFIFLLCFFFVFVWNCEFEYGHWHIVRRVSFIFSFVSFPFSFSWWKPWKHNRKQNKIKRNSWLMAMMFSEWFLFTHHPRFNVKWIFVVVLFGYQEIIVYFYEIETSIDFWKIKKTSKHKHT